MTGNLKLLINFVRKFLGTVRFGNDHVAAILGFGQFCDSDLEVAFRRNACFVRNLEGVDLFKGDRLTNLYTINLHEMASASPICLMARASSTKSWLWHQRLSHLNFDTINDLARNDLVIHFLRSKDEAPEVIITFLKRITVLLQSPVIIIRTDNGTEFKNQVLKVYFDSVGITHQMSSIRTPQQNGVVERRNQTLVEAARTMKLKAIVSKNEMQKEYWPKVSKSKNVGPRESLATPKPRKPRFLLRWSPTGKIFNQDGKLGVPSNSESHVDCSNGDNACTSNAMDPKIKRFLNFTSLLG
nr:integrase, catalytic region, zinc finger, CCHC-type, peptidase aspartic, catalytic [Tanacetum cinerariifolium]